MMAAPTKFMLMLFSLLLWQSFTFADQVPPSPKENECPLAAIGCTLYGRKLGAASAGFRLICPSEDASPTPAHSNNMQGKGMD
ncbi:hypothetical protein SLEP1_g46266 [Rubroshorea leprosula]|uniref:Uncharacterized protein n=1 Tax=Rubroshorea leprosula TaxID=152421 RepID=A0AAV5LLR0_9ROSI|nr:hypothetical protein SLEP1_g46266 [Rubroshorea leprosula]